MTDRITLVCNPRSGGADETVRREIAETLSEMGSVEIFEGSSKESFDEDVRAATEGAELVAVAAGDGTMNMVVNALSDRFDDHGFAVIPMGTGNDHVRTHGFDLDPVDAARQVVAGRVINVDVGKASGGGVERLFLNACMGGFPVEVDEAISEDLKARLGPMSFWVGGLKAVADLQRWEVRIGEEVYEDCLAVGIGNGRTAGGGIEVWPEADPSDGQLDLCVMPAGTVTEALKLATSVRKGEHVELPTVAYARAEKLTVEASPALEFNVDGELVSLTTPVTFEIFGRLRLRVPAG